MKHCSQIFALLLTIAVMFSYSVFAEGETQNEQGQTLDTSVWTAEDFTYDDQDLESQFTISPATDTKNKLTGTIHVITGLSEQGEQKLAENKNLVIPAEDTEQKKIQGVGRSAFAHKGLETVTFPENIMADNNGKWDESVSVRGDFFIGASAFLGNSLQELTLPEGVLYVGGNAFQDNALTEVNFPSTIMLIANQSFARNQISSLNFPETTTFPLGVDRMAFAINQIEEVSFPNKTEKVTDPAFLQNPGKTEVEEGSDAEKAGGVVYMYVKDPGGYIASIENDGSNTQALIAEYTDDSSGSQGASGESGQSSEEQTIDYSTWEISDFTYGYYEKRLYGCDYSRDFTIKGTAITGFSEQGEQKFEKNKDIVLPSRDPDGNMLVGVAPKAFFRKGINSVKFPSGMLVNYDDTVTHKITKRGNFIIADDAFAYNNLTNVKLPDGVIAVLPNAFMYNSIQTVTLPKTIWWLETQAFAQNEINKVMFPETTYFQFEMHGMPFAFNQIKSVRLPDYTTVVNKHTFAHNPGMRTLTDDELQQALSASNYAKLSEEEKAAYGVVYMYAEVLDMEDMDRIHHIDKTTESTKSWFQKLIINDGTPDTVYPDNENWNINDFTVKGTTVTGLSESGIAKRVKNKDLVIPDYNKNLDAITEIADAPANAGGLFGTAEEKFETVTLPSKLKRVGANAFRECGISDIAFPPLLEEIGESAFLMNNLESVILPDTVTSLGSGAFATNPKLEKINLSSGLTSIPDSAFACSDNKNWMKKLKQIDIPDGVTTIGKRAFAGNNFSKIVIPEGVTEIGEYAFSTKNYLLLEGVECEVELPKTLTKIGNRAFRNKNIEKVVLPASVEGVSANTFEKVLSTYGTPDVAGSMTYNLRTQIYVSRRTQYDDHENFKKSKYHQYILTDTKVWTAEDFEYDNNVIIGLSEFGRQKIETNKTLVIPATSDKGKTITAIGDNAFKEIGLIDVIIGEGIEEIGSEAFEGNNLTAITFPASVKKIGSSALKNNELTSISFVSDTTDELTIKNTAFAANKLIAVALPAGTKELKSDAFSGNPGKDDSRVAVYVREPGESVVSSDCQTIISNSSIPSEYAPWSAADFTFSDDGKTLTGLSDSGKLKIQNNRNLVLPDKSLNGITVTDIAGSLSQSEGTFTYKTDSDSYNPASVKLPSALVKIGSNAFTSDSNDDSISKTVFPNTLEEIGAGAFRNALFKELVLPDSVKSIGKEAFAGTDLLTHLVLPSGITSIPESAFSMSDNDSDSSLDNFDIPESVKSIGPGAFSCRSITSLKLPEKIETIGARAFENHKLESLYLPSGLTEIGENAFASSGEGGTLSSLTFADNFAGSIAEGAFSKHHLTEIEVPRNLNVGENGKINPKAFNDSNTVIIRTANSDDAESFNSISDKASYTYEVRYDKQAFTGWNSSDFEYSEDGLSIIGFTEKGESKRNTQPNLVLPDVSPDGVEIESIGEAAFTIDEGQVDVGKYDYNVEGGIETVDFPKNLRRIEKDAFLYNSIKELDFSKTPNINYIGDTAFKANKLRTIILPDTITELGKGAFTANNIRTAKLPKNIKVIPQALLSMNIRMEAIEIPSGVTTIEDMAFAGARLTSLTIPSSVTSIGRKAFHLHHLSELTIPGTVKEIGESAFEGTYKEQTLKSLTIKEGVESIGRYAFKEGLLKQVTIPNSLKTMGQEPFYNNTGNDSKHVVKLLSGNMAHKSFNKDAKYHKVYFLVSGASISGITAKTYTGKAITQTPTVKMGDSTLKSGTDYTLAYKNNVNAGTATLTITGKGNYSGSVNKTFTIKPKSISPSVSLSKKAYVYNGKIQTPAVTVKNGSSKMAASGYKIAYQSGRKAVGIYKITVTLKGNYSGSKAVTYVINPKGTTLSSLTAGKKMITIKWKKQAIQTTGYEVQYATNSTFTKGKKLLRISKTGTLSKKQTKLSGKKKYFVRIRTYKQIGSKKYYSSWSKSKAVTTK